MMIIEIDIRFWENKTEFTDHRSKQRIVSMTTMAPTCIDIPNKKRNAPLRTVQLSGKSQVIGQFSLYQCKGMSVTAASHVFCNQASKLC